RARRCWAQGRARLARRRARDPDPRPAQSRAIRHAGETDVRGITLAAARNAARAAPMMIAPRVDVASAKTKLDSDEAVALDVTSSLVYPAVSHKIPGAI